MSDSDGLGHIGHLTENENIVFQMSCFLRGLRFDHRRRWGNHFLPVIFERNEVSLLTSPSGVLPAARSTLSKGIFMINLCLALSMYCFPDGEFLSIVVRSFVRSLSSISSLTRSPDCCSSWSTFHCVVCNW